VAQPEGKLTPVQYEILEAVWEGGNEGATVTEIWEAITAKRPVTRTTILNLVDRLEKRGWLRRQKAEGGYRYRATADRSTISRTMAEGFLDDFFGGSASQLIMSLLGGQRLGPEDVGRLRELLDSAPLEADPEEDA
jgi:predicted transcriptional regulator